MAQNSESRNYGMTLGITGIKVNFSLDEHNVIQKPVFSFLGGSNIPREQVDKIWAEDNRAKYLGMSLEEFIVQQSLKIFGIEMRFPTQDTV